MTLPISVVAASGSPVDVDPTFFIQLGIFLFMFLLLRQFLFKPVISLIEKRREATVGRRQEAEALAAEAAKLGEEVERQLSDIRSAAAGERARMVEQAKRQEREILATTREETRGLIDQTKNELRAQAEQARQTLREETEALVLATAEKVLGRSI